LQAEIFSLWKNEIANRFDPKDRGHNATNFARQVVEMNKDRLLNVWYSAPSFDSVSQHALYFLQVV